MNISRNSNLLITIALAAGNTLSQAQQPAKPAALDTIVFGEDASEVSHGVTTGKSEVIRGALDQPARRMLPGGEKPWEGGRLAFTMKVDPEKQNYITVKFWGGDKGEAAGRLILYIDGKQVGYNKEGDYDVLNQCDADPLAPGRFVYATLPLPPKLTSSKTSLELTIVPFGPSWFYGQNWEQFQKPLTEPTRGLYRAYTHTAARFDPPAEEKQGTLPPTKIRATDGEDVVAKSKEVVMACLTKLLENAKNAKVPADPKAANGQLSLLAEAYGVGWAPTHRNPLIVDLIVRYGDAIAQTWARDHKPIEEQWSGAGPLGSAIVATWTAIEPKLDEKIAVGSGEVTRRQAYADVLRGSLDYWRTHRRSYTNQSMIVDIGIYAANRALGKLVPDRALPEAKTLRFLHESAGIEPWLGSDVGGETTGQSDVPMANIHAPYGESYYLFTKKGLSRELGWVATYGETNFSFLREMIELTGDQKLRDQLSKLQAARMPFRYPAFDADGYRCMKIPSEIDTRTAHYPLAGSAYNEPNIREAWWMQVPALLPADRVAVGAAQQAVEEGQYFAYVAGRLAKNDSETLGMMRNVDEWEKVRALPKSDYRLPMTPGQPDFVFADEENAVVALKHGDDMLFVNLYYRAERAVNRVARVMELTPQITRIATVRTDVEVISSGQTYTRADWTDSTRGNKIIPPGPKVHQAWAGEEMPVAKRPDDAKQPADDYWGPFLGKAAFYSLQYGDYLIGLNTTETNTYDLRVPDSVGAYTELVSKKEVWPQNGVVKVPPLSTVVLYAKK